MPARLAREPVLRLLPGSRGRRLLDEYLGRTGIRPASTIDLPNVSLMLSYTSRGLGIGLAPGLATLRLPRQQVVVERADVETLDVRLVLRPGSDPIASRCAGFSTDWSRRGGASATGCEPHA